MAHEMQAETCKLEYGCLAEKTKQLGYVNQTSSNGIDLLVSHSATPQR
jgi:hypothetical protein